MKNFVSGIEGVRDQKQTGLRDSKREQNKIKNNEEVQKKMI